MKIYVASSWRNDYQPAVVRELRKLDQDVYDFKNPREGDYGFGWSQIAPNWQQWTPAEYRQALLHPIALAGFDSDFEAMQAADGCVLVMPCGRSAHIEAGYFVGAGKPLWILLCSHQEPELMYSMADGIYEELEEMAKDIRIHDAYLKLPESLRRAEPWRAAMNTFSEPQPSPSRSKAELER